MYLETEDKIFIFIIITAISIIATLTVINYLSYESDLMYKDKCEDLSGRFTGEWNRIRFCQFQNEYGIWDEKFTIDQIKDTEPIGKK